MSMLEYSLIATIMCIALLFGVKYVGDGINTTFSQINSRLTVIDDEHKVLFGERKE